MNNTFLIRLLILRERKFLAAKAKAFCRRTIWDKDFLCLATILFTTSETTERGQCNHQDWSLLLWHHCIAAMQRWSALILVKWHESCIQLCNYVYVLIQSSFNNKCCTLRTWLHVTTDSPHYAHFQKQATKKTNGHLSASLCLLLSLTMAPFRIAAIQHWSAFGKVS